MVVNGAAGGPAPTLARLVAWFRLPLAPRKYMIDCITAAFFIGQTLGFGITTMDRIKLSQHLRACESCRKLKQDAEEETEVK